jgi:hypothetical protein
VVFELDVNRDSPINDNVGHRSPFLISLAAHTFPERIDFLLKRMKSQIEI